MQGGENRQLLFRCDHASRARRGKRGAAATPLLATLDTRGPLWSSFNLAKSWVATSAYEFRMDASFRHGAPVRARSQCNVIHDSLRCRC